jgi:hypothetical protein
MSAAAEARSYERYRELVLGMIGGPWPLIIEPIFD